MADLSDVENALVAAVAAVLYPNGATNPMAASIIGAACKTYRGWPIAKLLNADLAAAVPIVNISIYPPPGMEQNTKRYPEQWQTSAAARQTVMAVVDQTGTILTLGGAPSVPQNVAAIVNGTPFVYQVQPGDTLATIATGLAALVAAGGFSATASGDTVTVTGARTLIGRVGGVATVTKEVGRQNRLFQITFWCPTPALRDAAVSAVDPVLKATRFLTLADGSGGRLIYQRTHVDDAIQKALCYRRDLFYTVEYPTTLSAQAPQVVAIGGTIQGSSADFASFTPTVPPPVDFES